MITVVLDSIPPSLEITSPANGSIVSDTVTVTWTPGNNGSDVSYYTVSTNGTVWIIVEGDQYTFTDLEQGRKPSGSGLTMLQVTMSPGRSMSPWTPSRQPWRSSLLEIVM